ncbi:MAG: patatin-like phospholipase family protein, partial [Bacteroidota bacterium]
MNASFFEIGVLVSFIIVGSFREMTLFIIPAAASVTLFFTVSLMLISALFSWIKGWTFSVFIVLFVLINFSFSGLEMINLHSGAYGLDYEVEPADYSPEFINSINLQDSIAIADKENTISILEKWKVKNQKGQELPKMVIINTSGGGLRSALWSTSSLMRADSICNGELLQHTVLMTGSSGGMIGSSMVRESMLESQIPSIQEKENQISRDLLNPVMLSIATNDLFIRYQKFEEGNSCFTKDRAYAFEQQLHANTHGMFNKPMSEYQTDEAEAQIPMMVLAPSIVNDGRRMVISATPMSYMCQNGTEQVINGEMYAEDIEFQRFFAEQDALNLKWSSALRMNATFPYILPVTSLPSEPEIGLMDAGL